MEGWFRWRAGTAVLRDTPGPGGTAGCPRSRPPATSLPPRRPGLRHRRSRSGLCATAVAPRRRDEERHARRPLRRRPARPLVASGAGSQPAVGPWHVMRNGTNAVFSDGRGRRAGAVHARARARARSRPTTTWRTTSPTTRRRPTPRRTRPPSRRSPAPARAAACSPAVRCLARPAAGTVRASAAALLIARGAPGSAQRPHRPQARPQLDRPRPAAPACEPARGCRRLSARAVSCRAAPREANRPLRRRRQRPPDRDRPHPVTPDRRARQRPARAASAGG